MISARNLLSWPVIVVFLIQSLAVAWSYGSISYVNPFLPWLVTVLSILVISGGLLVITRVIAQRVGWARFGVAPAIGALVIAILLRTLISSVVDGLMPGRGYFFSGPVNRGISVLIVTLPLLIGVSVLVGLLNSRNQLIAHLAAEQFRLRDAVAAKKVELLDLDSDLRSKALELLNPVMQEVRGLLDAWLLKDNADVISQRLMAAVRDHIRPIAHGLAAPETRAVEDVSIIVPKKLDVRRDRMNVPGALRPGLWGLVLVVCLAPIAIIRLDFGDSVVRWGTGAVVLGLLALLKGVWPRRLRSLPVLSGFFLLLAVLSVTIALELYVELVAFARIGGPDDIVGIFVKILTFALVTIYAILKQHSDEAKRELVLVNAQLESIVARIRREVWLNRRAVSLAVHGPLQSMLVSAAMWLGSAEGADVSVEIVQRRLDDALATVAKSDIRQVRFAETIVELQALWGWRVDLRYEVELATTILMSEDEALQTCVTEVCREAISNAIRHGGATSILVNLGSANPGVSIHIVDNGVGNGNPDHAVAKDAGLGQRMFDEICLSGNWTSRTPTARFSLRLSSERDTSRLDV